MLDLDPATIVRKGRLQPGRMFLVDTDEHRIIEDEEIKGELAAEHPYDEWLHAGLIHLDDIPEREHIVHTHASVTRRQQVFGYTEEELRVLLTPMANTGAEPIGSMGTDTPIAALSDKPRLLFDYFAQLFAQVTNPPLDAIREELVTSLAGTIGPEANLLEPTPASCRQIVLPFPVIANDDLAKIRHINRDGDMPGFITHVSPRPVRRRGRRRGAWRARLDEICAEVVRGDRRRRPRHRALRPALAPPSSRRSRRCCSPAPSTTTWSARRPAPRSACSSRPATSARSTTSPSSSGTAPPRSTPTSPWSRSRTSPATATTSRSSPRWRSRNLIKALGKGVLKVMSKMGVSTVASYTGAQIFEAVGLSQTLVDRYFTGTDLQARRRRARRDRRGGRPPARARRTRAAGSARRTASSRSAASTSGAATGEPHLFDPETVFRLQHSTRDAALRRLQAVHRAASTSSPSG